MKPDLKNITSIIASLNTDELSNSKRNKLFSIASPIDEIDYYTLITNAQVSQDIYFYWAKPSENFYAIGVDSLLQVEHPNADVIPGSLDEIRDNFFSNWKDYNLESVPIVMGGRKFQVESENIVWQDFTGSDWFIPKIIFLSSNDKNYMVLNFFFDAEFNIEPLVGKVQSLCGSVTEPINNKFFISYNGYNPDEKSEWAASINAALADIADSKMKKIVLSREVGIELSAPPHLSGLIEKLSNKFPRCYIFAFRSGESVFIGASPEKLIKIKNNSFESDALAGSIKRGMSPAEDEALANSLLTSEKNIAEQKAVVEFIVNASSKFSDPVIYDKSPRIKKLDNIQHLWTRISGELKNNISMFQILDALHPTPAVCGVPCKEAMKFISQHEKHKRGLYSGAIGWFNFYNEAEFAVGIRSALIKGNKLYAYSGCGIVEGSNPESEYEESELKLKPILSLFENESSN